MAFGFTYTLPTITGSHSDFPVLLKTADFPATSIDGTGDALANGGGDLRAYTSDAKTTQIPLEIVRFVSSGSAEAEVWVKIPTAATSNTIFIEADAVETSQPAVTDTYGRNAVWSDYEAVLHLVESGNGTAGEYLDSTGNGFDGELTTGSSLSVVNTNHPWGGDWLDFTEAEGITLASSASMVDGGDITLSYWGNFDDSSNTNGVFGNWNDATDDEYMQTQSSGRASIRGGGTNTHTTASPTNSTATTLLMHATHDVTAGTVIIFRDGVEVADGSVSASGITGLSDFRVGTYFDGGSFFRLNGRCGEVRASKTTFDGSWKVTEEDNQSSSTAWGTVGSWADAGGPTANPKGPFVHPFYGPFRGPIS